eukprot:5883134-Pyramimonas_sp.AAC.1
MGGGLVTCAVSIGESAQVHCDCFNWCAIAMEAVAPAPRPRPFAVPRRSGSSGVGSPSPEAARK